MTAQLAPDLRRRKVAGAGVRVPWATVLPLAVLVAYADEFWTVSMRGAVGSIERSDEPFATWLWESTLLLPVYVLAVLAALTLALRWFGPQPRWALATGVTLVAVVATTTLAGIGVLAANSVYDYQLQMAHLPSLHSVSAGCDGCLDAGDATLGLQVRAVGLGSLLILVTNLVLVALVVAFRGGRLDVASRQRPRRDASDGRARRGYGDPRAFLAVCLLGTAAIHAAVVPEHLATWPAAGVFFVLLCALEVALAVLVLARPRPGVLRAVAAVSAGTVMLWLDSRSDGLPFGPGAGVADPVGLSDGAATVLEATTLVVAVAVLRVRALPQRSWVPQHRSRLAVVSVVAVASIGLGGGLSVFGGAGHPAQPGGTGGGAEHAVQHSAGSPAP